MKLLVVNTAPSRRNGITNVAFNLMKAIDKTDLQIGYVSISDIADEYKQILNDLHVKYCVLNRSIKNPFAYIRRLVTFAKGYDVIHVHGSSATMVLEMLAAKIAGVPLRCAHSHSTSCSMKIIDNLMRPLFNYLCNGRLACGKEAGEWLHGNSDFLIVNNGVDTQKFKFNPLKRKCIREKIGWDNNIIIANIANFVDTKNHEFLIEVFHNLTKSKKSLRLMLVGGGPLLDRAKSQVQSLGISDQVLFAGSVSNIPELLSAIDLIVMPSKFEGLPLTLVEEQANGLRAIVSDRVTKDADMTGHLTFIPLERGVEYWAEEILSQLNNYKERCESDSSDSINLIKKSGFDIQDSANDLKTFFVNKLQEIDG